MHSFRQNLRFAIRQLAKTPGLAVICVLTLALGIGANTAVFSVMNAVLLRSLPVSDPSRVREVLGWEPRYDDLRLIVQPALQCERKLAG